MTKTNPKYGTGTQTTRFASGQCLPGARPRRKVLARDARFVQAERGDRLFGRVRHRDGDRLLGCRRLSRPEGRTGVRGRYPDRDHRRRRRQSDRPQRYARTERHHPVDRLQLGRDRRRSDFYAAGALHSGIGGPFLPDIPVVAFRRSARHSAADPFPQVFRQGHAREIPVPRGHRDDRGARVRREEGRSGQAAGLQRSDRRVVRLRGRHVRLVDRERLDASGRVGNAAGR